MIIKPWLELPSQRHSADDSSDEEGLEEEEKECLFLTKWDLKINNNNNNNNKINKLILIPSSLRDFVIHIEKLNEFGKILYFNFQTENWVKFSNIYSNDGKIYWMIIPTCASHSLEFDYYGLADYLHLKFNPDLVISITPTECYRPLFQYLVTSTFQFTFPSFAVPLSPPSFLSGIYAAFVSIREIKNLPAAAIILRTNYFYGQYSIEKDDFIQTIEALSSISINVPEKFKQQVREEDPSLLNMYI